MDRIRMLTRMAYALGVLVLIAMALSIAALADIAHGETDTTLEWATLRITALLIIMYIGLSFAAIRSLLKRYPEAGT